MEHDAEPQPANAVDMEIDALIAEFGGDVRVVIAALLHDLTALAMDANANTSRGYVRGRVIRLKRASRCSG